MTSLELSTYLNLSVYTIYGLVHKRSLPFIKKGRRLYFEKKEIDKWLMQGRQMTKEDLNLKVDEYLMRNPR
ncbi:helix-turn-helix domain-containing protein [Maribacter sp. RZ05]|uniref:Helix-turn-helix domain-containing protein n=2 Tax=Maribacter luteus TaxID=2594478 RepID=A0A6I2MFG4_9FLAO|nr:helix-turn-helix domain-containing protein [Maribacter luteus]